MQRWDMMQIGQQTPAPGQRGQDPPTDFLHQTGAPRLWVPEHTKLLPTWHLCTCCSQSQNTFPSAHLWLVLSPP